MGLHWYTCLNDDCKSYNKNFSLVFDFTGEPSVLSCPFCHSVNIARDRELEYKNRHLFAKNLNDKNYKFKDVKMPEFELKPSLF